MFGAPEDEGFCTLLVCEWPGASLTVFPPNGGTISGIYEDNSLVTHGFTYSNAVFTRVNPPNSTASGLGGISNKGDVTATANVNNASSNYMGLPRH